MAHAAGRRDPILDLGLFRQRVFAASALAVFCYGAAFIGLVVFLPLFLVNVVGVTATRAGWRSPHSRWASCSGRRWSGQLVSLFRQVQAVHGRRRARAAGGMFLLSRMTTATGFGEVTLYMVICGLGVGPSLRLFTLAVQNAVDVRLLGQATALPSSSAKSAAPSAQPPSAPFSR